MKTLKIYIKNTPECKGTQIYCLKCEKDEELYGLKEKIFIRSPNLRDASEPQIYWYDLENDKIKINCNEDLRFFLDETAIQKLIFDYTQDSSRKRPSDLSDESISKRIRRQLEDIELSSGSSSMEFSDSDSEEQIKDKNESETSTKVTSTNDNDQPSTSKEPCNESAAEKVEILSVEKITAPTESANTVIVEDNEAQANVCVENINVAEKSTTQRTRNESEPTRNYLVISDSDSEGEGQDRQQEENRRFSDGNSRTYSSAYSFANINGDRFEARASFDDNFNHRRRRGHFDRNRFQRDRAEHFHRVMSDARSAQENAMRTARNAANIFPRLLNQFQNQFRPLFQPSWNQQFNSNFPHRF